MCKMQHAITNRPNPNSKRLHSNYFQNLREKRILKNFDCINWNQCYGAMIFRLIFISRSYLLFTPSANGFTCISFEKFLQTCSQRDNLHRDNNSIEMKKKNMKKKETNINKYKKLASFLLIVCQLIPLIRNNFLFENVHTLDSL